MKKFEIITMVLKEHGAVSYYCGEVTDFVMADCIENAAKKFKNKTSPYSQLLRGNTSDDGSWFHVIESVADGVFEESYSFSVRKEGTE